MLIEGLHRYGGSSGRALALQLARRWIDTCFRGFQSTGHMHEKYDATCVGGAGGGGEYTPQVGFGWTNGVVLDLLQTFGDSLAM